jgi:hypothetical protein
MRNKEIEQDRNVCFWRAPRKGGAFQWPQAPPGNRSSRKQPEQSWRYELAEAFRYQRTGGKVRVLSVPAITDRVLQGALKLKVISAA